jgi:hypothetical protein
MSCLIDRASSAQEGEALERASIGRAGLSGMALFEPVGCVIQKALATAVPIGAFKVLYAGEGLTVPKYGQPSCEAIRCWRRVGWRRRYDPRSVRGPGDMPEIGGIGAVGVAGSFVLV